MSIAQQHIQELLSKAYISAVVAGAGYILAPPAQPEYGIDGMIHAVRYRRGKLYQTPDGVALQIKSTTDYFFRRNQVIYEMDVDAYNKIARDPNEPEENPTILLLYCMPEDPERWLSLGEDELILRQCCYWHYEENYCSDNRSTKIVYLNKSNVFDILAVARLYNEYRKYQKP
jgi:hypothetical protein